MKRGFWMWWSCISNSYQQIGFFDWCNWCKRKLGHCNCQHNWHLSTCSIQLWHSYGAGRETSQTDEFGSTPCLLEAHHRKQERTVDALCLLTESTIWATYECSTFLEKTQWRSSWLWFYHQPIWPMCCKQISQWLPADSPLAHWWFKNFTLWKSRSDKFHQLAWY